MMPWELIKDPARYINGWLVATPIARRGRRRPIVDYWILRKRTPICESLYLADAAYRYQDGYNLRRSARRSPARWSRSPACSGSDAPESTTVVVRWLGLAGGPTG